MQFPREEEIYIASGDRSVLLANTVGTDCGGRWRWEIRDTGSI
jgi:hypothetical protein